MSHDIGSGSVCFDFCASNVVHLSMSSIDDSPSLNPNRCHHPLINQLIQVIRTKKLSVSNVFHQIRCSTQNQVMLSALEFCKGAVSKSQKQILKFSFEPKIEQKYFFISNLAL